MDDLVRTSATALAAAIRARRVSSVEVVEAHLRRIATINPRLNAVVQLPAETALSQARAADAALAHGARVGPLHGVPFTAKDVLDTAGVISAAGLTERAAFAPERDATVVARMRAAGAILIGKTNCPPGGGGAVSDNPVYGRTNNPYDPARTPGGSSGGEAAILAAGGSPLGLGSDSGGSIREPAHYCGVAGLRPTVGRVPATGTLSEQHPGPLSDPRTQIGPMARHVEDLGLALAIIAGPDWRDSGVVPMPLGDPAAVAPAGLRVAVYTDDGPAGATPETIAATGDAARALAEAGATIVQARPPTVDAARTITEDHWGRARLGSAERDALLLAWDRFRSEMLAFMEGFDAILCPVHSRPAPPHPVDPPLGRPAPHRPARCNYCLPYSLTGWPCAVVRAGTSPEGLPLGVQVIARPWREDVALALARRIEATLGGWRPPPF